jgi:hypothetical protein
VAGVHLFTSYNAAALQRLGGRALAFLPETQAQLEQAIEAGFDEILIDYDPNIFSVAPTGAP